MAEYIKEVKSNTGFGKMYQSLLLSKGTARTDWESAFRQQEKLLKTGDDTKLSEVDNFHLKENQVYKGKVGTKLDDIENNRRDIKKHR